MNLIPDWPEIYQIRRRISSDREPRAALRNPYLGGQPLHVVYGGAQLFQEGTLGKVSDLARRHFSEICPRASLLVDNFKMEPPLAKTVFKQLERIFKKPLVRDYRIDFEDGYGPHSEEEEDRDAVRAARAVASLYIAKALPPSIGIRVKALGANETFERSFRTLYLFLGRLLQDTEGHLPVNFVVTLPKVESRIEVASLVDLLELIESRSGIAVGAIQVELMVESERGVFGEKGELALPGLVEAARGRCRAVHLGAYDFLSSLGVSAPAQSLSHPLCESVRGILRFGLGDSAVFFSDGATLKLPMSIKAEAGKKKKTLGAENRKKQIEAWRASLRDIENQLNSGIYQGWDLHPNQIPIRYLAHALFFERHFEAMVERWRKFSGEKKRATETKGQFDDRASGLGILNFFRRGREGGVFSESRLKDLRVDSIYDLRSGD